ncbi:hypothetical protein OH491_24940 [Termitidicoccus mucosus]|uniref:Uncharacterized protein n=1 Tax=Termitidicoccus mucosus TaxID=1184151 RepID=A0A178IPP4_9BACT|nr:hypothetical protein AW736_01600 [Opitutaceae bacterium TSB47]
MKTKFQLLDTTDPRFIRRLAKEINLHCEEHGFYSDFGVTSEMKCGSRKFHGHVKVAKGRLMAREIRIGTLNQGWTIDLTGVESVEGNGQGTIYASRRLKNKRKPRT